MDPLIVAAVFVLVLAVAVFGAGAFGLGHRQAESALQRVGSLGEAVAEKARLRRSRAGDGQFYALLQRVNLVQWLEQTMWQAGLYIRVSELLLVMVVLFGTGEVAAGSLWDQPMLGLGLGLALAALPVVSIRFRKKRRLKQFAEQLPYALDLIKSLLEAGHSLLRGLQVVVKEFRDPIATEFATVLEQASLGLPLSRALEEMLKRVPEDDLRLLVVAVKVQSEVGSSLAQIIGRLSEIIRTRQRLHAQIRALTAQSCMSGIIVGLLPAIVLGAFSVIQPGYAYQMVHDPAGVKMLKVALGLDLMAVFTIRRLLKMNY